MQALWCVSPSEELVQKIPSPGPLPLLLLPPPVLTEVSFGVP